MRQKLILIPAVLLIIDVISEQAPSQGLIRRCLVDFAPPRQLYRWAASILAWRVGTWSIE